MATFFGEVLSVSSRAVDEDDEEDDFPITLCSPTIYWSNKVQAEIDKSEEKKLNCSSFIIACGIEANAFSEIYIKESSYEKIGGIFASQVEEDPLAKPQSFKDKSCLIYQCSDRPSVLLCQCSRDVLPEESFTWSKLLIDNINLNHAAITVLAAASTGSYCSQTPASQVETPFLRYLKTDQLLDVPVCPVLEQPNMLTGLPAMLMTFFQVLQLQAVVYVCYKENRYMDITDVKSFAPVLKATTLKSIAKPIKNMEKLKEIVEQHTVHDSMYM
ncbi:proteasome assembly chaperone 1-like [Physella acuta]|uniref:proteasome assembly chaperone 1-like n=1 Tax=Physella acuta TaxID=109671 RepID=UPI0027DD0626|nr:proteasome assembly chaperone 1-like [Physella acuta]